MKVVLMWSIAIATYSSSPMYISLPNYYHPIRIGVSSKLSISTWQRRRRSRSRILNYKLSLSSSSRSSFTIPSSASLPSPPPIDHYLLDTMNDARVTLSEDGIIETFDNDKQVLGAVNDDVVVVDLSHYGRIRVTGEDRIRFLHNQTTANFESLREGQGCDTVFVTPTARTVDLGHAWIMGKSIVLVVSPVTCQSITEMLNKYIFFTDKVEVQDITKQTCLFVLVGPNSNQVLKDLNLNDIAGQPYGSHKHYTVNGMPLTVAVGNIISEEGYSLLMSPAAAGSVWTTLLSAGAIPMGSNAWERLRIFQGRPTPGKELTDEYNVLEAGLWNSISLNKGCYKGQETISRLITYDGIKQRLWGIRLSSSVEPGTPITVDSKKVGKVTSYATGGDECEHFGLGYIKSKTATEGDDVIVGENVTGKLVQVPFLARQKPLLKSSNL